jgi:hypothetical protein
MTTSKKPDNLKKMEEDLKKKIKIEYDLQKKIKLKTTSSIIFLNGKRTNQPKST